MLPFAAALWLPLLVYLPQAVLLSAVDVREHRLPNRRVLALTLSTVAALLIAALLDPGAARFLPLALVTGAVTAVAGILMALLAPSLIGMGDAKTAPIVLLLAAALGPTVLLTALLGIAVTGGLAGIAVLVRSGSAATRFAFGPVLLAGPVLGLLGAGLVEQALGLR